MFKAIHHTNEARTFTTYAEAHRFVMKEGMFSRLWDIIAAAPEFVAACRAERDAFHGARRVAA